LQFIFLKPGPFGLKFDKSGKVNQSAGQAAEIGLKKGDVIVEVGGVKTDKKTIVERMKSLPRPGEIWVLRPGNVPHSMRRFCSRIISSVCGTAVVLPTSKKDKKIAANAKTKREAIKQGRAGHKPLAIATKKEVPEKLKPWEAEEEDETWLSGSLSWCALRYCSIHALHCNTSLVYTGWMTGCCKTSKQKRRQPRLPPTQAAKAKLGTRPPKTAPLSQQQDQREFEMEVGESSFGLHLAFPALLSGNCIFSPMETHRLHSTSKLRASKRLEALRNARGVRFDFRFGSRFDFRFDFRRARREGEGGGPNSPQVLVGHQHLVGAADLIACS
jgi:hypothetical protein